MAIDVQITESKGPSIIVHGKRVHRTSTEIRIDGSEAARHGISPVVGEVITVAGTAWTIDEKRGDSTVVAGPEIIVLGAVQDSDAFVVEYSEGKKIKISRPNVSGSNSVKGRSGNDNPFVWENQPAIVGLIDIKEVRTLGFTGFDEAKRRFVFSSPPPDPEEFVEPETKDVVKWNSKDHTILHIMEVGIGVWAVFCSEGVPRA